MILPEILFPFPHPSLGPPYRELLSLAFHSGDRPFFDFSVILPLLILVRITTSRK